MKKWISIVSTLALLLTSILALPIFSGMADEASAIPLEYSFNAGQDNFQYGTADGASGVWDCQVPGNDGSFGIQFWSDNGGWINTAPGLALDAATVGSVSVRIKNAGPNDVDKFYIAFTTTDSPDFSNDKRIEFTIKKASESADYVEYTADLAELATWSGTIDRLRMQTGTGARVTQASNWMYVDYIRFFGKPVLEYSFNAGQDNFQYGTADGASGVWGCQVPGNDGSFGIQFWSDNGGWINTAPGLNLSASSADSVSVRIKNAGPNDVDEFYIAFTTTDSPDFSNDKRIEFTIKKASESADYVEYTADLAELATWNGTIDRLRMQTGTGARVTQASNWMYVDYIRFFGNNVATDEPDKPIVPDEPERIAALHYTFNDGMQNWQYGFAGTSGGIWDCIAPGADGSFGLQFWSDDGGWLNGPDNLGLPANSVVNVSIRLRNAGPNEVDKFYLYFTTNEDPAFNDSKRLEFAIQKPSETTDYVEYTLDPTTVETWAGTIKQLRMVTGYAERVEHTSNWIYIDDIFFEGANTKDASLKALSAVGHSFDTPFNSNNVAYTLSVPYETDSITLDAVTNAASATVEGAGERALSVGSNELKVTVTSEDGTVQQVYTVTVTRREQVMVDDATLRELLVTPNGVTLDPAVTDYTIEVVKGTKSVTVAATPNSERATVAGIGTFELTGDEMDIPVTVTAEDGITKKTYTIHVKVSEVYGYTFNDNTIQNWKIGVEGAPIGASIASLTAEGGALRLEVDAHYGWMTNTGLNWDTKELKWLVVRVKNNSDVGNLLRIWFATDENPNMYAGSDSAKTQRIEMDIMMEDEYNGYWEYGFDMTRLNTWSGKLTDLRFDFGRSGEGNPSGVLWVDSITFQDEFTPAEKPDPNAGKNDTGVFDFEDNTTQSWTAEQGNLEAKDGKLYATFSGNGYLVTENLYINLNAGDRNTLRLRVQNNLENADKLYVYFATSLFPNMRDTLDGQFTQRLEAKLVDTGDGFADIEVDMSGNIRWMGELTALGIEIVGKDGAVLGGSLVFDEISLPVAETPGGNEQPGDGDEDNTDTKPESPDTGVASLLFPAAAAMTLSGVTALVTRKKRANQKG